MPFSGIIVYEKKIQCDMTYVNNFENLQVCEYRYDLGSTICILVFNTKSKLSFIHMSLLQHTQKNWATLTYSNYTSQVLGISHILDTFKNNNFQKTSVLN